LHDTAAADELLTLLDDCQPGHLAPMLHAERDLVRARLAASDGDVAAEASFATAISGLRELSTPYHLANGLLDHAQHLTRLRDTRAAAAAIGEAHDIAGRLRCQPLPDRAAELTRKDHNKVQDGAEQAARDHLPGAGGWCRRYELTGSWGPSQVRCPRVPPAART
jgi:hypothetical protein